MLGLPFVVFSVANCITLRTGCFISRLCPAWSEKNWQFFPGVNDTSVVTHKQTFNRQACAIKKEALLLLFELSISLCTRTVNRFHGRIQRQRFSNKIIRTHRQWQRSSIGVSIGGFFAVPKTTLNYFLRNWNTKLAKFFTSFACLV